MLLLLLFNRGFLTGLFEYLEYLPLLLLRFLFLSVLFLAFGLLYELEYFDPLFPNLRLILDPFDLTEALLLVLLLLLCE